jgi:uncharacterized protein YutE (UPF0331/DUF86 family)/predicted nucleotidyltransferase
MLGEILKIKERINQQASQITELLHELQNEKSYRGIERLIQLIIQALLDLGIMAIAAVGKRTPKGYSEVGELLSDLDLLDEKDAKILKSMAGMRNILVHAYATVNRDIVIDSASKLKEDVPRIVKAIKESLEVKTVDPPSMDAFHETLHRLLRGRVKAALLFGGRAKGYSLKGDYDIAVFFGRPHDLYDLGELAVDITRTLKISEDKLSLIELDSAPPEIMLEALNGKPIFVEDEYILFELKLKAIFELLDIRSGVQACLKSS